MKVFKYELKIVDEQTIAMAYPAEILTVMPDVENDRIMVYALADEDSAEFISRSFVVVGTGNPFDMQDLNFLGSVRDDWLRWHVFCRFDTYELTRAYPYLLMSS